MTVGRFKMPIISSNNPLTLIKYGLLYNHYAVVDSRNICASGWHIPTLTEKEALRVYLDPLGTSTANVSGKELKESGTTYWSSGNTGTNSTNYNGRGSGQRNTDGTFSLLLDQGASWTSTIVASTARVMSLTAIGDAFTSGLSSFVTGRSLRLIKDSTTLSDGEAGTYTGNDGKVYRTICINGVEYLADNLAETKFQNGDWIPGFDGGTYTPFTNSAWAALTTAGMCVYNNDLSNL